MYDATKAVMGMLSSIAFWGKSELRRLNYTPQQLYCSGCTERTFYLMAQDDGTLEAYCVKNNHKRVLVNVPELAQEVYAAIEGEIAAALGGGSREVSGSEPRKTEVQDEGKANDAAIQHGAPTKPDSAGGE